MTKEDKAKILLAQSFKRKTKIKSKVTPKFPMSDEREYKRLTREYMRLFEESLKEHSNDIEELLKTRQDARSEEPKVKSLIEKLTADFALKISKFNLSRRIERLAASSHSRSVREWQRAVHKSLGIDLKEDFFRGKQYEQLLKKWTKTNVELIKTIPFNILGKLKELVNEAMVSGETVKGLTKKIMDSYAVENRYAEFVAVDQLGKLSGDLAKMQQTSIGVNKYIWSTSKDARVRSSHRVLHGKEFSWDDPPIVDYRTGRRCHPGQDYRCRCVAIPVFEKEEMNIPVEAVDWQKVDEETEQIIKRSGGRR